MLLRSFSLLALMFSTASAFANDDIAKVERLGNQAYAALVCWPDNSTAAVNNLHNEYFKRRVGEIIAITDAAPEPDRKLMFGKIYPGLHNLAYFQDEHVEFRKGYALASMVDMLKALRVKGPNQNPPSAMDQALCAVFDVNT
jgi:hypothetical protein